MVVSLDRAKAFHDSSSSPGSALATRGGRGPNSLALPMESLRVEVELACNSGTGTRSEGRVVRDCEERVEGCEGAAGACGCFLRFEGRS